MSPRDYGYAQRPDPPPRFVVGGTQPSRVGVPSKDQEREGGDLGEKTAGRIYSEDGRFKIEPELALLTVTDEAGTARVLLGDLGDDATDYGIEVYDAAGSLILGATGLGLEVVDTVNIVDGAVTLSKVSFTVVGTDNVVATINASAEGITIQADKLTVGAETTFLSGYDPTTRADVVRATTAPTTRSDGSALRAGDLWIDTDDGDAPYTYSGSAWVRAYTRIDGGYIVTGVVEAQFVQIGPATDYASGYDPSEKETPAGAQAKADLAETDAYNASVSYTDAEIAAGKAQVAAIIRATTAPATRTDGTALQVGDLWIDTDDGNAPWSYSGSMWIRAYTRIDGGYIVTGTLDASVVTVVNLNATNITTGELAGARIAANAVTASKLAALYIESGKYIRSTTYTAGSAGWSIDASGAAEFNNVTVRGTVYASAGTFAGTLVAATGSFSGTVTASAGAIGGWTLSSTALTSGGVIINASTERILLGSATAPLTGIGVFLGKDGSAYEFRAGNPAGEYIHWDGSGLTIRGTLDGADGSFSGTVTASAGTIGGWTLSASALTSGSVSINASTERILMGSASAPLTGTGVFLGKDGANYEFRVGNPAGDYIHWDGAAFHYPDAIKNPPRIYGCLCEGSWNGTGTDYTITWSTASTVGSVSIAINYYRGGALVGSDAGLTNDGSHTRTISGGSSGDKVYAVVMLSNSSGETESSQTTKEVVQTE